MILSDDVIYKDLSKCLTVVDCQFNLWLAEIPKNVKETKLNVTLPITTSPWYSVPW